MQECTWRQDVSRTSDDTSAFCCRKVDVQVTSTSAVHISNLLSRNAIVSLVYCVDYFKLQVVASMQQLQETATRGQQRPFWRKLKPSRRGGSCFRQSFSIVPPYWRITYCWTRFWNNKWYHTTQREDCSMWRTFKIRFIQLKLPPIKITI